MEEEHAAIVSRLGVTPEQLIGYGYAGLLAMGILAQIEPINLQETIKVLGAFLTLIVALALGVGLYVFYFRILGEFILYPTQHLIHGLLDCARGKTGKKHTSCVHYIGTLGVPLGCRRAAYEAIKASFYSEDECRRIQLSHGELHVLYLTAMETAGAAIYLSMQGKSIAPWSIAAIVFYLGALLGDIKQHSMESIMLRARGEEFLRKYLTRAGYC